MQQIKYIQTKSRNQTLQKELQKPPQKKISPFLLSVFSGTSQPDFNQLSHPIFYLIICHIKLSRHQDQSLLDGEDRCLKRPKRSERSLFSQGWGSQENAGVQGGCEITILILKLHLP